MCGEVGQEAWGLGLHRYKESKPPAQGWLGGRKSLRAEPADAPPTSSEPQDGTWSPRRERTWQPSPQPYNHTPDPCGPFTPHHNLKRQEPCDCILLLKPETERMCDLLMVTQSLEGELEFKSNQWGSEKPVCCPSPSALGVGLP